MDKNKSRTDLLAAGRKRLQQFRQKKDGKGSNNAGKSSKKSGKPEHLESETDAATSAPMPMASSHTVDEEVETATACNLSVTESSGLQSLANSSTPEFNVPPVDSSSVDVAYEANIKAELASIVELELQNQVVAEADSQMSVQNEGGNAQDAGTEMGEVNFEGGVMDDHISTATVDLSSPASVAAAADGATRLERQDEEREECLLLPEKILSTSLTLTREDQVTDVGTMQDADGSEANNSFQSCAAEIDGHEKTPLSEVSENAQVLSGIALGQSGSEDESYGADQVGKAVEESSVKDIMSDNFSASTKGYEDATAGKVLNNLEGQVFPGLIHEEGENKGLQEELNQWHAFVGSAPVDKIHELSVGAHEGNADRTLGISPISDVNSINLVQLTEIINGLSEEEYHCLVKSRRTVSHGDPVASVLVLQDFAFLESFERVKEELFLANLKNDILNLQMTEQLELQQESDSHRCLLINELSDLRASHSEINDKNHRLVEELANCQIELHDVVSKNVELQSQFKSAQAKAEAFSARVVELENNFELSQRDSLDLSTELTDCIGLVTALQTENNVMSETLSLMIGEKNKLEEEKEFHLFESKKLSTELADLKGSAEELRTENSYLSARLSSVTEDSNKTEMEAEHPAHEIGKLSAESVESKDLVASLQLEISNLTGSLELLSDQQKKLEEDKQSAVLEAHVLLSLIASVQDQLSAEKGERMRFEVDLKEATAHLEQLTEENTILNSSLDACKAKIEEIGDKYQAEALQQHCSDLEASNIEFAVQYEAAMQRLGDVQEKKNDLEELCRALKEENLSRETKNTIVCAELGNSQLKISQLRSDLHDMQQISNHMASVVGSQLENLLKEVTERATLLEQGWNTTVAEIVEIAAKLDGAVGEDFSSTTAAGSYGSTDINHRFAVSVNAAAEVIADLRKKLETAYAEQGTLSTSFEEMNTRCNEVHGKNELAVVILNKIYHDLGKLVHEHCGSTDEDKIDVQGEPLPDLLNYSIFETVIKSLGDILNRRLELESITREIKSDLMHKEKEMEELNMKCLDLDVVGKLVDEVEGVLEVDEMKIKMNKAPLSCLESLVTTLVQKTREAELQEHIAKEGYGVKVMELSDMQEKMRYLETLCAEHENEILILRESLRQAEETHVAVCSELNAKSRELEQAEQRVSSTREKLSIAVSKGKGLVVQRDGLKQSLAETSSELERCLQELRLKDTIIHEVEAKLKTYAEAGERVEALESELSYIRNSANALRESFLHKDSLLQRIEEILEDLDLPEQFHSRDLIEKIDWLARSAAGNSLPMNDSDQKISAEGGSFPGAGFDVTDAWKDVQQQSDTGEDLRKNFEELQSKFYVLAEQNEMLEQSLMERNRLVQSWEELVDRIDMPSHLRSMETVDRIEWLGRALVEANHYRDSLQLKIEQYDSYCGLLNTDLEESQRRVSALQADLRVVTSERKHLSDRLESLEHECEKLSLQAREAELGNDRLSAEVTGLEEKLKQKSAIEEQMLTMEGRIKELQDLVGDALQEFETEYLVSGKESIDSLEVLLRKLLENYTTLSATKPAYKDSHDGQHTQEANAALNQGRGQDIDDKGETAIDSLKKDLEAAFHELMHVKEERDRYLDNQIALSGEVEALTKRAEQLQQQLDQEEQKSASVREKLNVAVRKGKMLVQQRDGLKQTIEEMTNEIEHLKSENNNWEHALAEFVEKFKHLSSFADRLGALEPETASKRSDPVSKLESIGKLCSGLHATVASLEQESMKSKRAAELLLAELNEVQERNDAYQEELAKATGELVDIRKERDLTEADKLEAISHLEKLSTLHMEESNSHFAEIMGLKSSLNQLHKGFSDTGKLMANAFFVDLESFRSLKVGLESCMKAKNAAPVVDLSVTRGHDSILGRSSDDQSFVSEDPWSEMIDHVDDNNLTENSRLLGLQLQKLLTGLGSIKESIHTHLSLAQEQGKTLSEILVSIQRDMISQRESCEAMKKEISEKDGELIVLRENIAHLYQACANSIAVIEYGKADLLANESASSDLGINFQSTTFEDGIDPSSGVARLVSGEYIKTLADRLLLAANEVASIRTKFLDANQKEMKAAITNLQRELQEKDVQRDRICMDLVNQIKAAEGTANNYFQELQSSKMQEQNLVKQIDEIEAERKILEQKVNALQDRLVTTGELEEKIRCQLDLLSGKDQEIEALTQALDEEEMQMEELTKKIQELEKVIQHKNMEIENLEASNGKVTKKLSITVSKFDELHHLSSSLLAEVENLQSQLQERDSEISFLRQEVTRCTNDLLASQNGNKRSSDEILEFLMWVDMMVSQDGMHDMLPEVNGNTQADEYKEVLHKKLISLLSEIKNLRAVADSKDAMLNVESRKVEELTHKAEALQKSLHEKESRLNLLDGVEESGEQAITRSEIVEVEPVINKWTASGTSVTPQVRSLRKGNNDHVAIAVDVDRASTSRMEDDEEDKVHGFKPLTSSKIVPLPRFTRPLTDMIDGLWVSCDRALMRQPALRLGIMIYWAIMHTLLAFFVV
ncbi:golgin subfamily A member 4 isoform X2 [Neltuma alba]|uniref:golgin subfamily A member 4 isoform X2 n=1 Tax=Neltuma alba TaxID=207710 RepID=UPI0010A45A9D|nr:golgin subfamily A member 4-like isoform X2 [Prosopis alba]